MYEKDCEPYKYKPSVEKSQMDVATGQVEGCVGKINDKSKCKDYKI